MTTLEEKIQTIINEAFYASFVEEQTMWVRSVHSKMYDAATLLDKDREAATLIVIGTVTYADIEMTKASVTVDPFDVDGTFNDELNDNLMRLVSHESNAYYVDTEKFKNPCRDGKMRFVRKKSDNGNITGRQIVMLDFNGNDMSPSDVKNGDLVVVDFIMQTYKSSYGDENQNGVKMIPVTIQVLDRKEVSDIAPASPCKRRKF